MNLENNRKLKPYWVSKAEEMGDEGDTGTGGGGGGTGGDGDSHAGDAHAEGSAAWGEKWREDWAQGDEKKLNYLGRYATPHEAFNAGLAAANKISSGEFRSTAPYPEEGTEEEQAAWRADNGIPSKAEDYQLELDEGVVIGEEDKEFVDSFKEFALNNNMPPSAVSSALNWYYQNQEEQIALQEQMDDEIRQTNEDALRADWGDEYRGHINRIHGLLDMAPEGLKDKILTARYPDGTPMASDNETLKWFLDLALTMNPATTVTPAGGQTTMGAITDRMAELKTMMKNDSSEYWKGPKADQLQAEYRDLLTAQANLEKRGQS